MQFNKKKVQYIYFTNQRVIYFFKLYFADLQIKIIYFEKWNYSNNKILSISFDLKTR